MIADPAQPTLDMAIQWAKQAGAIAREGFLVEHHIDFKGATDLVTEIDHACERVLVDAILTAFPSHSILTEESGALNSGSENRWHIDPLDGTVNYARHIPMFAISLAYEHAGQVQLGVVYDPSRDECYAAQRGQGAWLNDTRLHIADTTDMEKCLFATAFARNMGNLFERNLRYFGYLSRNTFGVRRLGSAALELCYVASGQVNAYWELAINSWDMAAAALIAEESGAIVTTPEGDPDYFKPPYAVLASAPGIHNQLIELFRAL